MKKIIVIPGDGIGKEITDSAVAVLKKIDEKFKIGLEFDYRDAGGASYDKYGEPLMAETLDARTRFYSARSVVQNGTISKFPNALKRLYSVFVKV